MASTVDERGRILIPKDMRDAYGLTPGSPVRIESTPDGVQVRRALPQNEVLSRLEGAITDENRAPDARAIDPLELKRMWEPVR